MEGSSTTIIFQNYLKKISQIIFFQKAAQLYKENILEQFKNGSHATRSTRGTKTSPFSVAADDNSNIWEIYADRLHAKHNISKRQTAGTQTPASCTNPAANCANFVNSRFRTFDGWVEQRSTKLIGTVRVWLNDLLSGTITELVTTSTIPSGVRSIVLLIATCNQLMKMDSMLHEVDGIHAFKMLELSRSPSIRTIPTPSIEELPIWCLSLASF